MSPKLPHLSSREVVRLLECHGFTFDHQTGSHAVFRDSNGRRTTVPMHSSRTVGVGLLRQILKDSGIDPDTIRS